MSFAWQLSFAAYAAGLARSALPSGHRFPKGWLEDSYDPTNASDTPSQIQSFRKHLENIKRSVSILWYNRAVIKIGVVSFFLRTSPGEEAPHTQ
jgi:hypothetical protein